MTGLDPSGHPFLEVAMPAHPDHGRPDCVADPKEAVSLAAIKEGFHITLPSLASRGRVPSTENSLYNGPAFTPYRKRLHLSGKSAIGQYL